MKFLLVASVFIAVFCAVFQVSEATGYGAIGGGLTGQGVKQDASDDSKIKGAFNEISKFAEVDANVNAPIEIGHGLLEFLTALFGGGLGR